MKVMKLYNYKVARHKGESLFPNLWPDGGWYCPSLQSLNGPRLFDISGRNTHATLTSMEVETDWVISENKGALDFDGVNDSCNITSSRILTIYPFTLSAWAYPRAVPATNSLAFSIGTGNSNYFAIGFVNISGNLRPTIIGRNTTFIQNFPTTNYSLNQWYHLVGVFASATSRILYVNGVRVTEGTTSVPEYQVNSTPRIGSGYATLFLNALIDDCRIFSNQAFNPYDVQTLYQLGRGRLPAIPNRSLGNITTTTFKSHWLTKRPNLIGGGLR